MPVRSVCDALGVTRQHLNRLFVREVGVGTKFFSRVVRFHSALGRVPSFASLRSSSESNSGPASAPESWSSLAIDAGYFDQAHFIDECRALSGLSPTRLIASR
jgi:methylphosphotriester-DNA--protein-cysteine methyltransferase